MSQVYVGPFRLFDDALVCTPTWFNRALAQKDIRVVVRQNEYISAKLLPIPEELQRIMYSYLTGDVTRTRS